MQPKRHVLKNALVAHLIGVVFSIVVVLKIHCIDGFLQQQIEQVQEGKDASSTCNNNIEPSLQFKPSAVESLDGLYSLVYAARHPSCRISLDHHNELSRGLLLLNMECIFVKACSISRDQLGSELDVALQLTQQNRIGAGCAFRSD